MYITLHIYIIIIHCKSRRVCSATTLTLTLSRACFLPIFRCRVHKRRAARELARDAARPRSSPAGEERGQPRPCCCRARARSFAYTLCPPSGAWMPRSQCTVFDPLDRLGESGAWSEPVVPTPRSLSRSYGLHPAPHVPLTSSGRLIVSRSAGKRQTGGVRGINMQVILFCQLFLGFHADAGHSVAASDPASVLGPANSHETTTEHSSTT